MHISRIVHCIYIVYMYAYKTINYFRYVQGKSLRICNKTSDFPFPRSETNPKTRCMRCQLAGRLNERIRNVCEYFSTKALKCGTRSSVANPSSPLPQNSPLTSYLVLPLQPNGMSCTCASMPTNYHACTRASCTRARAQAHNYVCSGMCELWARSSFQAHPGTPPVRGGATRDRYPSVCTACLTRFDTLPNYITPPLEENFARQKGYPKSLSLASLSVGRTAAPGLSIRFERLFRRYRYWLL